MQIKNYCSIIILSFLISCSVKKKEANFPLPTEIEINEVIKAVVEQDSLNPKIPIQIELMDVKIWNDQNPNNPPPPLFKGLIEFDDIIFNKPHNIYLSVQDTAFLRFQSVSQLGLKIDSTLFNNHNFIDSNKVKNLRKKFSDRYYTLTKPIFSLDHKKAYIQLELRCFDCGHGMEYFLIKENNKWRIALGRETWIA